MTGVLHHAPRTRSFRVLWTLEEVGRPYQVTSQPFPPRTRAPQYLEVNPTGTIPAWQEDERLMTESMAICQVLAEEAGRADLQVAPGAPDRADYLQWLWCGEATLSVPLSIVARSRRLPSQEGLGPLLEDVRLAIDLRMAVLEARMNGRAFVAADHFTLADVSCAYPMLQTESFGLTETLGPNCGAYFARLKARPAFQRAMAVP
jgi:glutathione S-transferase